MDFAIELMNNNIDWQVMDREAVKCKIQHDLKDAKVECTNLHEKSLVSSTSIGTPKNASRNSTDTTITTTSSSITKDSQQDPLKIVPHKNDVLATGLEVKGHHGNNMYLSLVHSLEVKYCSSKDPKEKDSITQQIIKKIQAQIPPGRFLKIGKNGNWEVMSCVAVRKKVQKALRRRRERLRSSFLECNVKESTTTTPL